ncbi:MAG TPA: hypothetical protein VFH55_06370 [Nitrospiria bacterium]|nr:hypothetical protein [Nitrospiria bacterium]HTN42178.1 hypothetical protein [Nitrospiria bacterium]
MRSIANSIMVCALLTTGALSIAHAHGRHVMGRVIGLGPGQVQVRTTDEQTLTLILTQDTKVRATQGSEGAETLQVGDRLVADVVEEQGRLVAREIRFSRAHQKKEP